MIKNILRKKARELKLPLSTLERDFVQNWILKYINDIDMVFKGGTAIRKIYIENYRFSDDLDFTLINKIKKNKLDRQIKTIIEKINQYSEIRFKEKISIKENDNGFVISVYFQLMQIGNNFTKIKIDITKSENEEILIQPTSKKLINIYNLNEFNFQINTYNIEEIFSEKIRSLMERTRPRDIYDIWSLWEIIDFDSVYKLLPSKFKRKKIRWNINDLLDKKSKYKNAWEQSLKHQIEKLPVFEKVWSFLINNLSSISWEN